MEVEEVCAEVLKRIRPTKEEEREIKQLVSKIEKTIKEQARERNWPVKPILVGSVAKNTWIKGIKDIDMFLAFPESLTRDELEDHGIRLAKVVVQKLKGKYVEEYAEHPYLTAEIEGYRVDLVPCYHLTVLSEIKSAVDRTPFHTKYIRERLTEEQTDQVRLLKRFMYGIGVYGSDLKTKGFSGYLCELLILYYESFLGVLKAASKWKRKEVIDIRGLTIRPERMFPQASLIVIDPVDKNRNVAAVLSRERYSEFVAASREFLKNPKIKFFFPPKKEPMKDEELSKLIEERGKLIAISFPSPKVVPDILWPQMERALKNVESLLKMHSFRVMRKDVWANRIGCLLLELSVWNLPKIKKHLGPPIWISSEHQKKFIQKWVKTKEKVAGPYLEGDRWVVEVKRKYTEPISLLEAHLSGTVEELEERGFPKHIAEKLQDGGIYKNQGILELCKMDRDFRKFLAEFLTKQVPWL